MKVSFVYKDNDGNLYLKKNETDVELFDDMNKIFDTVKNKISVIDEVDRENCKDIDSTVILFKDGTLILIFDGNKSLILTKRKINQFKKSTYPNAVKLLNCLKNLNVEF